MYLEEIEIIGFKSFANKTVLKFPKPSSATRGITAVVGPNGSGKSNVADAIRWVLGEMSTKTLRGKSRDDVIFSGSAKKNRMNFAEVTLRLNNEDKSGDVELSNIEITRRVFRDGESEFLLNKNKARREDIIFLLAKAGVGQKTYTVIGQGMADAVLSASLQDRREFFEEAAGVKQYQLKRQQTLTKFESARENLAQTELTIKEIEPRLRSLQRQMKKLEQREEIEKELRATQNEYYSFQFNLLSEQINTTSAEKNGFDKESKLIEEKILKLQAQMNEHYSGDSRHELFTQLQQTHNEEVQKKNSLLREQALLKAKKDSEYQKAGKSDVVWLSNKKEQLENELRGLQIVIKNLDNDETGEQKNLLMHQDAALQLDKKITTVKNDLESIRQSNIADFDEESDLRDIYKEQESLLNDLLSIKTLEQLEPLRNQARTVNAKLSVYIEKLTLKKKTHANDLTNLQAQLEQLIIQKDELNRTIAAAEAALKIIAEKKISHKKEIENKESEIKKLETEIQLSTQNDSGAVTNLIESELAALEAKISIIDREIAKTEKELAEFNEKEQEKKEELMALQKELTAQQNTLNKLQYQLNQINIEIAKFTIRLEDLEKEILEEKLDLKLIKEISPAQDFDQNRAHEQIHSLKKQLEVIGGIDEETIREFNEINERYNFLTSQTQDLESAIISMEKIIEQLDQTIKEQFDKAFKEINREFQKYFQLLFHGGKAELLKVTLEEEKSSSAKATEDLENAEVEKGVASVIDKLAAKMKEREKESYGGIEIKAEPPGKKINSISMLSGGERALTSIALISAIIANNRSPFVFLDEMDAALDESNALRFATILKELSNVTQFIVITHTRATMTQAQLLYGVTMGDDGVSKLLSIELQDAEKMDVVRH